MHSHNGGSGLLCVGNCLSMIVSFCLQKYYYFLKCTTIRHIFLCGSVGVLAVWHRVFVSDLAAFPVKQTNFSDILVFLSSSMAFSHLSHRGYYARSSKIPQARHIL